MRECCLRSRFFILKKERDNLQRLKPITEEDFEEILEVNADHDVEINGNKLSAADFLEIAIDAHPLCRGVVEIERHRTIGIHDR